MAKGYIQVRPYTRARFQSLLAAKVFSLLFVLVTLLPAMGLVVVGAAPSAPAMTAPPITVLIAGSHIVPNTFGPGNPFPCAGSGPVGGFGGLGGGSIIVGKLAPDGEYILVTVPQLTGFSGLTDCSLVFGNTLDIYDVSPLTYNTTATVIYTEFNPSNTSQVVVSQQASYSIAAHAVNQFSVNLPSTLQQRPFELNIDGVYFVGYHLTPLTLLPNGILTIGGLDLLIILTVVEAGILIGPLLLLSRFLVLRAVYAPKFRIYLWLPLTGFIMFMLLLTQYQWLDQTFGGLSYLIYPVIFAVLLFLWSLHLFNRAEIVEVLKPEPASGHRLRYLRWTLLIGRRKDGSMVLIDPRWRGFLYALFGHFVTLVPAQSEAQGEAEPAPSDIENRAALPLHVVLRRLQRQLPSKESPTDDFTIINAEKYEEPSLLFWVDSDQPFELHYPYASIHREVEVPEERDPETNVVTKPAHTKLKLSLPHIVTPPSEVRLAGIHYWSTPVAALGWMGSEKAHALLEKRSYQVVILRSRLYTEADRMAEERIAEIMSMIEKERAPPTDEELNQEVERLDKLSRDPLLERLMAYSNMARGEQPSIKPPTSTSFHTRKPKRTIR